jgi:hypothetical protein
VGGGVGGGWGGGVGMHALAGSSPTGWFIALVSLIMLITAVVKLSIRTAQLNAHAARGPAR